MGFDFGNIMKKSFKGQVKVTTVTPDLRGKIIITYGGNSTGKTSVLSQFPNSAIIACNGGTNAINNALVLEVTNWADIKNYIKTFLNNKEMLSALKEGETIVIGIDEMEYMGNYLYKSLKAKYDKEEKMSAKQKKYAIQQDYSKEIWEISRQIKDTAFTIIMTGHATMDNIKTKKIDIAGEEEVIKPFKDIADVVLYLESNGIDKEGNVVPSTAYSRETKEYFARSKFTELPERIEEYTAENFTKALTEAIEKQNKKDGVKNVDYFERQEQEGYNRKEEKFEDVMEEIKEMVDKIDEIDEKNDNEDCGIFFDETVEKHLQGISVKDATPSQIEAVILIRDELKDFLSDK